MKEITKNVVEGEECTIIGHLLKCDNHLGRSLVIDLEAPKENQIRQVDHRTIQSIILRNVKFNLGKTSTLSSLPAPDYDHVSKWENSKLNIGNWLSDMQYFKLLSDSACNGDQYDFTKYCKS